MTSGPDGVGMTMRILAVAGVVLLTALPPAAAQMPKHVVDACLSGDTRPEARIEYCSRVIVGTPNEKLKIEALAARADTYFFLERHDEVIADLDQAIALDPQQATLYSKRAYIYAERQQHDLAIADLNRTIKIEPKDGTAFYNRGNAHAAKQQYDRAVDDYTTAIRLKPSDAEAYAARGVAYANQKQLDRALADYDRALQLDPVLGETYYNRALIYHDKRRFERAVADLDQATTLLGDGYGRAQRCWTRAVWGEDLDSALSDCNFAINLSSKRADFFDSRGLVHLKAGRALAAEQDYTAALTLKPDDAHHLYGRGIARLRQGKTEAGNADLAAARKLDAKIDATYAELGIKP